MRLVLALLLLAALPAETAAAGAHAKRPAAAVARLRGVVAWTGRVPDFADAGCDLQPVDLGDRTDISGGLSRVVVVVEPLGAAKPSKHAHKHSAAPAATSAAALDIIDWDFARAPFVGTAHPNVATAVRSPVTLRFFAKDKLLATVPPSTGEGRVVLPEGIVKVVDDRNGVGSIFVTPYFARLSNGNCRFSFLLAPGRYRLRGWHPQAGERTLTVDVPAHEPTPPLHFLLFSRRKSDHPQ